MEEYAQEFLYHYTSIENLALILKNRTIRLNTLDKMDDLQEQKTRDVQNFGKFFFVSSWTSLESESIPMWKMYTCPSSGVRIKLAKNPFKWQYTKGSEFEKIPGYKAVDQESREYVRGTFVNWADMMLQGVFSPQAVSGELLHKVEYTADRNLLEPQIITQTDERTHLSWDTVGKYKNLHWKFQEEWRYLMVFVPMDFLCSPANMAKAFHQTVLRMKNGTEVLPFSYYDLPIDETPFCQMEITPSPQMTAGFRLLLDDLVEKYNPTATIKESELLGLI